MNKMMLGLILLLFSFPLVADVCDTSDFFPETSLLSQEVVKVSESQCADKLNDHYMDLVTGCLSGGWKAGAGMVQGFIDLIKLLLIDAPSWLWKEASESIEKLISGDLNPLEMSIAIANINLSSQSSIWDTAKDYWDAFVKFSKDLKNTLVKEIKGFPCLPLEKQSEIICQGVTNVFLLVVSPTKFIQGAKWGVSTARALTQFVNETKVINGLEKTSLADRLKLATTSMKGSTQMGKPLLKLKDGQLFEVELPDGQKIIQYIQNVLGKDGKMHQITREVPLDAKTLAIDSNSAIGKEILNQLVKTNAGTSSLIFVDVNYLGKTNYFAGGTQAGDQYLTSVGESLRRTLRPGDMVFKNGGDELVVVLGSNNPQVVRQISQRMINEVDHNPVVRQIFRQEVKTAVQKYRDVNRAKNLNDLPESLTSSLTKADVNLAKSDFENFKKLKLNEYKKEFQEQATYRGSISVGSSLIKSNEDLPMVLKRAEEQASRVKAEYKIRTGHDISKYNINILPLENVKRWSPPMALDPN